MATDVYKPVSGTELMEALDNLPVTQRTNQLKGLLTTRISSIEDVLPGYMKGEGQRFINRAAMYFATKRDVQNYSMGSVVAAIIQAAELGLAIDGRLAHIVKFGGEAVLNIDYKGLVSIAKRSNQITDCYGDVVGANDSFECGRNGPESILKHVPHKTARGAVEGAYAIVVLPGSEKWRYEYMTIEQLDHVKSKSKAQNGPWKTDTEQMQIKTVIRRALKLYCDDPSFIRALEIDEQADAIDVDSFAAGGTARVKTSSLSFANQASLSAPPGMAGTIPTTPPGTNATSTPRSQRRAEEESEHESNNDVRDQQPADGAPAEAWAVDWLVMVNEATTNIDLDGVEKIVKDAKSLTDDRKLYLVGEINKRRKALK